MFDTPVMLTPLHYAYLIGVIAILAVMVRRRDTPAVCIAFLFILGVIGLGSVAGGIMTVFNAVLYAAREFMEVIATIALVTALSKCLKDLGSDYLMMVPMSRVMKTPSLTWWILGLTMFLFSLFLWPSPSVALVGAIMLPFAVKAGLNPLAELRLCDPGRARSLGGSRRGALRRYSHPGRAGILGHGHRHRGQRLSLKPSHHGDTVGCSGRSAPLWRRGRG